MHRWWKKFGLFIEFAVVIVFALAFIYGTRYLATGGIMECSYARVPALCAEEERDPDG